MVRSGTAAHVISLNNFVQAFFIASPGLDKSCA